MSALLAQSVQVALGGRTVLRGVDLALRSGEATAIVGPNGAGKSTLLSCLAGLRRPDAGEVRLGGAPLAALGDRNRARRIGYLPQTPEVAWRLDVRAFVQLGRTAHRGVFGESLADKAAVDQALAATALTPLAGRDVTTLSGGERARALIARALAGEPDWLMADEPLSGLDPAHQFDAAALLKRFAAEGGGVVLTLHDLTFAARMADRVVVIADGEVVADGAPMAALSERVLTQAYGLKARWIEAADGPLLDIAGRHG